MSDDRRVHAATPEGWEIVRYDRAGKWYAETLTWRERITFDMAVYHATRAGAKPHLGLPGGTRFDAAVQRKIRAFT
jgi:hypothetical protein